MNTELYDHIIKENSSKFCIEEPLIKALIKTESSFNYKAYRYEPKFYDRYIKNRKRFLDHPLYNEPKKIAASYGLCQIMTTTFEELGLGTVTNVEILYDPYLNIKYCCKLLRNKINKYGIELGVLAYNSGSPLGKEPKEEPNYKYLKKIAKAYKEFGGTSSTLLNHA